MAKFLVTVALLMAVAFAAKQITIMNYAQDGCTGTANASKVDVDTCIAYKYENWTAMKFGFPRDLPVATIYPDASSNCTTLGNAVYVPCGRCAYSGRPEVGYYRYLCDVKRQAIRADLECNSDRCDSCAHHFDIKVGECTKYANGTKNVQIGALGRMSAIPEIMFDNPNATCTFHTAINIYDVVCFKCLGRAMFNCTLTDGGVDKKVSGHPLKPHLGHF